MKVVYLTDADIKGSGYRNLSMPLCDGLLKRGYEVRMVGLAYQGQEHEFEFPIIPATNLQEALAIIQNLANLWKFDVLIVALDIPMQEAIMQRIPSNKPFQYLGIMPIEADPLCLSWAMVLAAMDKSMVISEFGTEEAHKAGISETEHLRIGIDTQAWRQPTPEEREKLRLPLGLEPDTFAVLTVADNQERKNLSLSMEAFAEFAKDKPNARYILVTREHNNVGWKLRDYAQVLGIHQKLMIFERGMGFKELWSIYVASDAFLLLSKTEGLGMPVMEAMAVGLPCIGTNCSGIKELLSDNRGFLVDSEYIHIDCFGNGHRYWANKKMAVYYLDALYSKMLSPDIRGARLYVEGRDWESAVNTLDGALKNLIGGRGETSAVISE